MINSQDIKKGTAIRMDGGIWVCIDFQHRKPGKGNTIRTSATAAYWSAASISVRNWKTSSSNVAPISISTRTSLDVSS